MRTFTQSPGDAGRMLKAMVESPKRLSAIVRVPFLLIPLLDAAGKLPTLPPAVEALLAPPQRHMSLSEGAALTWLVIWDGQALDGVEFGRAAGVAAYRDVFDYTTRSDVRELLHVTGSAWPVFRLLRWMARDARSTGRRLIGSVSIGNSRMEAALKAMGAKATRVVYEDRY